MVDYVPLFPRYELEKGKWKLRTFPPNMASARDIPTNALLHASLRYRITDPERKRPYVPKNNHGCGDPCLDPAKFIEIDYEEAADFDTSDVYPDYRKVDHKLYALDSHVVTKYKADSTRIARNREEEYRQAHTHISPSVVNGLKAPTVSVQEISN